MVIGNGESLDSNINSIPDRSSSSLRGKKILLGVTGSVAAVKAPALVRQWVEMDGAHVQVLLTAGGRHFWDRAAVYENGSAVNDITREFQPRMTSRTALSATESNSDTPVSVAPIFGPGPLPASVQVHYAEDEWQAWEQMGDPVLHIDLRDWADILVVAPLSAHTLAKFAHGLCDDTLSCVIRAWDFGHRKHTGCSVPGGKPLVLVPAMNTAMWDHPLTHQQLSQIQSWHALSNARFPVEGMGSSSSVQNDGKHNTSNEVDSVFSLGNYSRGVVVVPPQSKRLACGDVGFGAMAEIATIREMVQTVLLGADANSRQDG